MRDGALYGRFELKAVDAKERVIEGYAAVTGNVDEGDDVIDAGAFKDTLEGRDLNEILVPSVTHDRRSMPVGMPIVVREDGHGLFTKTKIHNTQAGNDLLTIAEERLAAGAPLGISIGYKADPSAMRYERKADRTVRHIGRLHLGEYSFTAIPMNKAAVITAVKSGRKVSQETFDWMMARLTSVRDACDEMEDVLRSGAGRDEPVIADPAITDAGKSIDFEGGRMALALTLAKAREGVYA